MCDRAHRKGDIARWLLPVGTLAVAGFALLPPGAPPPPPLRGALVAHRAGLAHAPENSLQAIRYAASAGAGAVELDVRLGPDGPVCAHDPEQVPGAPALDEALELALGLGLMVELDLKEGRPLVREVVRIVDGRDGVWVSAFDPRTAWWVRRLDPTLPLGWPMTGWGGTLPAWLLGASVLEPREDLATPERVRRWLDAGWTVEVWTVHDPERVDELRAQGAAVVVDALP